MAFTRKGIELLLDLVENKISYMDTEDREAARELKTLKDCRTTLVALSRGVPSAIVPTARQERPVAELTPC